MFAVIYNQKNPREVRVAKHSQEEPLELPSSEWTFAAEGLTHMGGKHLAKLMTDQGVAGLNVWRKLRK